MQRRKVEIVIDPEQLDITKCPEHVQAAIGYLAMWAIGSERYVNVSIYSDRHGELNAVYKDNDGKTTYVMGAVPREDGTFSYHS